MVLLAALGRAAGTFATTRLPVPPSPLGLAAVQVRVGAVVTLAVGLAVGERLDAAAVAPVSWWAWGYLAVLLGVLVAGERYTPVQLAGGTVVLGAVVLVILAERRAAQRRGSLAPSRP